MAKAKVTSKKAVAKKVNTPTKAVAKKAVAKTPAKKAAPAKKVAVVKKAAPAKKVAAPKKAAPTKKVVAPKKATPAKKATAPKKATPAKKATAPKQAVPTKKLVAPKKATPAKKADVLKKAAPAKKVAASKKAVPAKKAVQVKSVAAPKKAGPAKKVVPIVSKPTKPAVSPKAEKATKKTTKKEINQNKIAPAKAAIKAEKPQKAIVSPKLKSKVEKPLSKSDIVDAVNKKSELKAGKPGEIAFRDLKRDEADKKETYFEEIESFNPVRTSILSDENSNNTGPTYRYSDEELNEFKEIVLKRLETAREYLNYYQNLMARKGESGTDDTDNRFNTMEDGSGAMEREQLSLLASRQMQFIDHLEKALMRIENKTYGICRVTGKLIDKARLKAVPHATLSIEAKASRR